MKYSVIIPVYKAEVTLARCLDSLLRQERNDAELLLINDGSPDRSGEICLNYAERYKNVRYFSKDNGGVSSARNLGIENATGTYVMFVDSDDYVTDDYFSAVDAVLDEYDFDLIVFSHIKVSGQDWRKRVYAPCFAKTREQTLLKISNAMCRKMINQPWAKVYKRSIIEQNDIVFPQEISVGEDCAFNIQYSLYIDSFRVSDLPIYNVCVENTESLSRKQRNDLDEQISAQLRYIEDAFQKKKLSSEELRVYRQAINFDLLRTVYMKAKYMHKNGRRFYERIRTIRVLCRQINDRHLSYPKSHYCRLICAPVRWRFAVVIDAIAWKLTHS